LYTSKAASVAVGDTIAAADLYDFARMAGLNAGAFAGNTTVGSATPCNGTCPDSLNQRLDLAFNPGAYSCISPTYDGKCADLATLADKQGLPGPVTVVATDTTATLTFHTPTAAACPVDIAPWAGTWATSWDNEADIAREEDPAPDQEQEVVFTGLTPATSYVYRGHCARAFIGQVTTAGAP
jgi:hypothetical protein